MKSSACLCDLRCALVFILLVSAAFAAEPDAPSPPGVNPATTRFPPSAFAALGSSFAQTSRLPELGWDEAQIDAFIEGVRAALHGRSYPFDETARQVSAEMGRRVQELEASPKGKVVPAANDPGRLERFMKETRKRLRLQQTDSGLGYRIEPGHGGPRPRLEDTVIITCLATAADGTTRLPQISSDHARVKMTDLLPGFVEGLQMMTVDSKAVLVIPPALFFGDHEWPPGVERGAPIIYEVTLHEIIGAEAAP